MSPAEREHLVDAYAAAFDDYLSEPTEFALARAYELGRRALAGHLGVLDIAAIHAQTLAGALTAPRGRDAGGLLDASQTFFAEALSPFEMAHRGYREANTVLRRINDVLEAQGKRIASALHDEAAQMLIPVHLGLADVARKTSPEIVPDIQQLRSLLEQVEVRLRDLSHELRPPLLDDLGLVPALEYLCDSTSRRWGIPIRLASSITGTLPPAIETALYRITQEALVNVAKHAGAGEASVSLQRTEHAIVCSVRDDGIGLDAAKAKTGTSRGMGLAEINERVTALGGILRLGTNGARGTDVTVEIPLET